MMQLLLDSDSTVLRAAAAANQEEEEEEEEEEGHLVSNGRFAVSEHGPTNRLPVS
jgi:hypothetical protein